MTQVLHAIGLRILHRVERRRAMRGRRDPALIRAVLARARRVLVLCQGNIIRSPFAARLIVRELGSAAPIAVASAGLGARPGCASPPAPVVAASRFAVDLTDHTAAAVTGHAVASADVILVMDVPQLIAMRRRFPDARNRTFLLTCLAHETALEVRDPIDGDELVCGACFQHISQAVRPVVGALLDRAPARPA